MYVEKNSPESILHRMKNKISTIVDKEEGSFTHDALVGTSEELGYAYSLLDDVLNRVFINRALENEFSDEIDLRCGEMGIYRKNGTYAKGNITFKGEANVVIPLGTTVQTSWGVKFNTIEEKTIPIGKEIVLPIKAKEIGSNYNLNANSITELENQLLGVTEIVQSSPISGGTNKETDKELVQRYIFKVTTPSTSGNASHYKQWALECEGVGDALIIPTWQGGGTVKVILLDSNKRAPSTDIVNNATSYINKMRPIGAVLTVVAATEMAINISVRLQVTPTTNRETLKSNLTKSFTEYIKGIAFKESTLRITRVGNIILDQEGVIDYSELQLNSGSINIEIAPGTVPILGSVVTTFA